MYQSVANSQSNRTTTTQYSPPATSASGLSKPSGSCVLIGGKRAPHGNSRTDSDGTVYKCQNGTWILTSQPSGGQAPKPTSSGSCVFGGTPVLNGKSITKNRGTVYKCQNGTWIVTPPPSGGQAPKSTSSGSCALNDGTPVSNGKSNTNRDGSVYKCKNGTWILTSQPSGGQAPKSTSGPTFVQRVCESRATGMTSSWSGTYYTWRIYDIYSDGSRRNSIGGGGYNPPC